MKNLVLCGFMGSGKTTVGKLAAKRLGLKFVDMDDYIERSQGMRISEIFEKSGEEAFRAMEREACRTLAGESGLIIATGGGALTFPGNVQVLSETGLIVFLDVTPETVLKRLRHDTARPLLAENREERVRSLLARRRPLYQAAAFAAVNANGSAMETAEEIIRIYRSAFPI